MHKEMNPEARRAIDLWADEFNQHEKENPSWTYLEHRAWEIGYLKGRLDRVKAQLAEMGYDSHAS